MTLCILLALVTTVCHMIPMTTSSSRTMCILIACHCIIRKISFSSFALHLERSEALEALRDMLARRKASMGLYCLKQSKQPKKMHPVSSSIQKPSSNIFKAISQSHSAWTDEMDNGPSLAQGAYDSDSNTLLSEVERL
ncbi:hypothetical protein BT96DRAFT_47866 [Gymnopus androsaceus JB14]|uniref:Uncharacterized protein n=1 Tax=Gymnopus androsaceus JB14 TaxID=1447944 RepID=A0A6A4HLI8_9AGAR|nr:hypothetical protein BT96DRAFT_47866 [Gymnopus androsaceus JB14]